MPKHPILPRLPDGHKPLKSRRDFLAHGLVQGSVYACLPSMFSNLLFEGTASAADCPAVTGPASGLVPFFVMDMAGGYAGPGNFVVGGPGGPLDALSSYAGLGVPANASMDASYGAPFWSNSKVKEGLDLELSAGAKANTRIMTICHFAQDDTTRNELSPVTLIGQAGLVGTALRTGTATPGTHSAPAVFDKSLTPMLVRSSTDIQSIFASTSMSNALLQLGQQQAATFQNMVSGPEVLNAYQCFQEQNVAQAANVASFDWTTNTDFTGRFTAAEGAIASVVYNGLKGNTGPGVIQISGCDYHTGNRTTGDTKDREIGKRLGQIIEQAHRMRKPVVIAGITDGGVYANGTIDNAVNLPAWIGDRSVNCLTFVAVYHPTSAPVLNTSQIGSYTKGVANPGADTETFFGKLPQLVAHIVLANYLQICERMDIFDAIVPDNAFPKDRLSSVLGFG